VSCVNGFLFTQQRNISDNFDLKVSRLPGFVYSKSSLIIILQLQILSHPHGNDVDLHSMGGGLLGTLVFPSANHCQDQLQTPQSVTIHETVLRTYKNVRYYNIPSPPLHVKQILSLVARSLDVISNIL